MSDTTSETFSPQKFQYTGRGINAQGNYWSSRDYGEGKTGYYYLNKGGSYYYRNPDGSTYYNDGKGTAKYTSPDGTIREWRK